MTSLLAKAGLTSATVSVQNTPAAATGSDTATTTKVAEKAGDTTPVAGPTAAAVGAAAQSGAQQQSGSDPGRDGNDDRRKREISSVSSVDSVPVAAMPVQPSASTTPAAVATPTTPGPAAPVAPHELAAPIIKLRNRGDGDHEMTLALHPADLGPVNVHVRLTGNEMTIQLASTNETAHAALHDALPQLRAELQDAGLSSNVNLSMDVSSQSSSGNSQPKPQNEGRQSVSYPPDLPKKHTETRSTVATNGLDRWL